MRRAALYTRVSTSAQADTGTSLQSQLSACRTYASTQGYTVTHEAQEDVSGATLERAGLDGIRDMAGRREIDALIVYDPDRLSRNLGHLMLVVEELERAGVQVCFVNAPHERTPEGMMLLQMRGMFAQYEKAKIAERSRRGKDQRVKSGQVINTTHTPYGYRYNSEARSLDIVPQEAEVVRALFNHVAEGDTMYSCATALNERGVPTPGGGAFWRANSVREILRNEVYMGVWTWNKRYKADGPRKHLSRGKSATTTTKRLRPRTEWLTAPVPAIVSEAVWHKVQQRRSTNRLLHAHNRRHEYLLGGMVRCGCCGTSLSGWQHSAHTKAGAPYRYYRCTSMYRAGPTEVLPNRCTVRMVRAEALDAAVWDELVRQLQPAHLEAALQAGALEDDTPDPHARLQELGRQERALDSESDAVLDLYLSGSADRAALDRRMEAIKKRREQVAQERANVQDIRRVEVARQDALKSFVRDAEALQARLGTVAYEDKRAFLVTCGVGITVYPTEDGAPGHLCDVVGLPMPVRGLYVAPPQRRWRNGRAEGSV